MILRIVSRKASGIYSQNRNIIPYFGIFIKSDLRFCGNISGKMAKKGENKKIKILENF